METPRVIAVCGFIRCGTSCVAGMLSALGVPMGNSWLRPSRANPRGFFEDAALHRIRKESFRPLLFAEECNTHGERVVLLRRWLHNRVERDGLIVGCKLPGLCLMIPDIVEAWPNLRIIIPDRDPEDALKSRLRNKVAPPAPGRQCLFEHIQAVLRQRDAEIARLQPACLRFSFEELMDAPGNIVGKIIAFCELEPEPTQVAAAIAFVEPGLAHFRRNTHSEKHT